MIPAVAQTLAKFLSGTLSQIEAEQVSFEHPRKVLESGFGVNLYCYDIRLRAKASQRESLAISDLRYIPPTETECEIPFLDISFVVTVRGGTRIGEQHLLSEILCLILTSPYLPVNSASSVLAGGGLLPMRISSDPDPVEFWSALQVPLHMALHVTVTLPLRELPMSVELG